ncbi:MAG: hypothetical protein ABSE07_05840 [Methanoregula sp.]
MKGCYIKQTKDKVQSWQAIPWQYCPVCRVMLLDYLADSPKETSKKRTYRQSSCLVMV